MPGRGRRRRRAPGSRPGAPRSRADVAAPADEVRRRIGRWAKVPWFAPGAVRSARRVFLHVIAETAQHAGHADVLRESLDGQKTTG
ncbi:MULTISPECIES: mycothiol transferase [Geodermatophilus]|uniref:DUF664 domain-containing protein n=1 Tax=Geodermatophilus arenarius TaxID=1137990 RepID=A0ABV9LQK0_9ACTN